MFHPDLLPEDFAVGNLVRALRSSGHLFGSFQGAAAPGKAVCPQAVACGAAGAEGCGHLLGQFRPVWRSGSGVHRGADHPGGVEGGLHARGSAGVDPGCDFQKKSQNCSHWRVSSC